MIIITKGSAGPGPHRNAPSTEPQHHVSRTPLPYNYVLRIYLAILWGWCCVVFKLSSSLITHYSGGGVEVVENLLVSKMRSIWRFLLLVSVLIMMIMIIINMMWTRSMMNHHWWWQCWRIELTFIICTQPKYGALVATVCNTFLIFSFSLTFIKLKNSMQHISHVDFHFLSHFYSHFHFH